MFLAFIALSIVGVVFFFTILLFCHRRPPEDGIPSGDPKSEEKRRREEGESGEYPDGYVPILHAEADVPGLSRGELVHYRGEGKLYTVESSLSIVELSVSRDELTEVMTGALALTSKAIIIFEGESKKKFYISSIEDYRFHRSYLILKRKNVKRKKDIIEISPRPVEFRYILHTLAG